MTIQEIKSRLSILTVLSHYSLAPDKNNMLKCPWHEDKKASMKVYPETNTVYCFAGSCAVKNLDAIDFIMRKDGVTKHEAILKAKQLSGHTPPVKAPATKVAGSVQADFERYKIGWARSPKARAYLESRCLEGGKPDIAYKSWKQKGAWAKGCVIFALRDAMGEVVSLYGRSITGPGHYYQTNRQGLYPIYPKSETKTLVLFESIIDTATLQNINLSLENYSLLALYGTNGLTAEHRSAILDLKNLQEIIFALDGDEAGRRATQVYGQMLQGLLPGVKFTTLNIPEDEDINSLAMAHEQREALFTELFNKRTEIPATNAQASKPKIQAPQSKLNTSNPYNLIYASKLAIYYVKGGIRHTSKDFDHMKITLVIENETGRKSRNKLDLYEDKQLEKIARTAGEKLELRPDLIELDLQALTDELETYRETLHLDKSRQNGEAKVQVPIVMQGECLEFLKKPELLQRTNELIGRAGVAGETINRLLLFVVASSFKMPHTLHALIQGASGSGKTRLLKIVSELMPAEEVKRYTRVTDGSFYNQPEYFFKNKLLCFEDIDGLKEDALLAVRELQSNEILITSTSIKDDKGGIRGGELVVRGPIASISCTTKAELYEDNISRCFVVAVNESPEQDERIIKYQNDKAAGLITTQKEKQARSFLQNCIRLLHPCEVINPFANRIHLPREAHKIRRLNELYQSFVRQITLLNQYQRKRDSQGRLISQKEDLQTACDILFESIVLKVDELDGSLRQFFEKLKKYVQSKGKEYEFNRFEVRKITGVSKTQQHYYVSKLVEMEYLRQWGFANKGYQYKIAHWDNMEALRQRIKVDLEKQLNQL